MTLSIQTNQLKTRKHVQIDGHDYTVRKMGNIEQLDIAQYMRRLKKLTEVEKAGKVTESLSLEVDDISAKMSRIFISLFDDGGDQSKSRELVSSLSDVELALILKQIFDDEKVPSSGQDS